MQDNIKIDLKELGWKVLDWIHLAKGTDRWTISCESIKETSGSIKGEEFLD
jgi:hypothetical protein